jgi:DNA-binding transcriptional LysR family regulator
MNILRNMSVFVRVAEAGSFTAGAEQSDVTTAQASRSISELEAHLRTRLLNRTTRRIALTDAGNRYLHRCKEILALVEASEAEAGEARTSPDGVLRIHAPLSFGQIYVVPALTRYLERYPLVRAEVTLSQRIPDLLDEGFDVSLQIATAHLPNSALVSARICTMPTVLCASPKYIESRGSPRSVSELHQHTCLQLVTPHFPVDRWRFEGSDGAAEIELLPGKLRLNSADALAVALVEGFGIGPLPDAFRVVCAAKRRAGTGAAGVRAAGYNRIRNLSVTRIPGRENQNMDCVFTGICDGSAFYRPCSISM